MLPATLCRAQSELLLSTRGSSGNMAGWQLGSVRLGGKASAFPGHWGKERGLARFQQRGCPGARQTEPAPHSGEAHACTPAGSMKARRRERGLGAPRRVPATWAELDSALGRRGLGRGRAGLTARRQEPEQSAGLCWLRSYRVAVRGPWATWSPWTAQPGVPGQQPALSLGVRASGVCGEAQVRVSRRGWPLERPALPSEHEGSREVLAGLPCAPPAAGLGPCPCLSGFHTPGHHTPLGLGVFLSIRTQMTVTARRPLFVLCCSFDRDTWRLLGFTSGLLAFVCPARGYSRRQVESSSPTSCGSLWLWWPPLGSQAPQGCRCLPERWWGAESKQGWPGGAARGQPVARAPSR